MIYYLIASIYCLIFMFALVRTLIYFFRSKSNMIYISRSYIVLPVFMVVVSCVIVFSGLTKQQVEIYDTRTILVSSIFSCLFLIIGSTLIFLITSWKVKFKDSYLEYSNYKESNIIIRYDDIKYIDAFRPSSNDIIYIKTQDDLLKINHNFIMGSINDLTQLISMYRKKK